MTLGNLGNAGKVMLRVKHMVSMHIKKEGLTTNDLSIHTTSKQKTMIPSLAIWL